MENKNSNSWLLSSFLVLFVASRALASEGERKHFLSHGPGARSQALGEAFTAVSDDVTAIYYNPAGLAYQPGAVHAEYTPVFGGGRYNFLGAHYPSGVGSFGFGIIQYADSSIEGRQQIGDDPNRLSASQTAFYMPYAKFWNSWAVGGALKIIHYSLAGFSDTGWGADAGVIHTSEINDVAFLKEPQFNVGVSAKNLLKPSVTLISDEEQIPTDYKAGVALKGNIFGHYSHDKNTVIYDSIQISADVAKTPGQRWLPSYGGEYSIHQSYALRMGFSGTDISGGIGYLNKSKSFSADYAFSLTGIGPQHRFSLSYKFAEARYKRVKAEGRERRVNIFSEARRYRDRHMRQGKALLDKRDYEGAAAEFEAAAILDPKGKEARHFAERAHEGARLARVKNLLDSARLAQAAGLSQQAEEKLFMAAGVLPLNEEVRSAIPALRNAITKLNESSELPEDIAKEEVARFDAYRDEEVARIKEAFDLAIKQNDILTSRRLIDQADAVCPDHRLTMALHDKQKEAEEEVYVRAIQSSRQFRIKGEYSAGYVALQAAKLVHKDADAVHAEEREYRKAEVDRRKAHPSNKVMEEELYNNAALHYVKGDYEQSLKELNELLGINVGSGPGNDLRSEMLNKKIVKEDVIP